MNSILTLMPWRRLMLVGKPFWTSNERSVGYTQLIIVLGLLAAHTLLAVFVTKTAGRFMNAIETRSLFDFYYYLVAYVGALIVNIPVQVYYHFYRTRLSLTWREWLSNNLLTIYFSNQTHIRVAKTDIDNPEQRMTQDVDSYCNNSVSLSISFIDASMKVITFLGLLWSISPGLSYTVMLYSSLGLLVVLALGKDMSGLVHEQLRTEADLRTTIASARSSTRKIKADSDSLQQSKTDLSEVIRTLFSIALLSRKLQMFTTGFELLVPVIPAAIIAPLYFDYRIDWGTITQAVMAFTAVFHGATIIIAQFHGISFYAAVTNRIGSLIEVMTEKELKNGTLLKPETAESRQ